MRSVVVFPDPLAPTRASSSPARTSSETPSTAGAPHDTLARRYYDFVTTPEALLTAADSFVRIPARTDLPAERLPQWIRDAQAKITPMPLDRALMADSLDAWMRHWDAHVRNSARGR